MICRQDLYIRDPFLVQANGRQYLIGSKGRGVAAYATEDMEHFSDPMMIFEAPEGFWATKDYWAPEVHEYRGKWYLFLSLKSEDACRGTQIFRADAFAPERGVMFEAISDGPQTPRAWECLDGTLYEEDGVPYMVFCHEWLQVSDGEICAIPLAEDLSHAVGEPKRLFRASESGWAKPFQNMRAAGDCYVTDGCFMHKMKSGALAMLWSSFRDGYCLAAAISDSGRLAGPWRHDNPLLCDKDGGHGMIFTGPDGGEYISLHAPNGGGLERLHMFPLCESDGVLTMGDER